MGEGGGEGYGSFDVLEPQVLNLSHWKRERKSKGKKRGLEYKCTYLPNNLWRESTLRFSFLSNC